MNVKDPTIEPLKPGQTRDPHDRLYVQDLVTLQIYRAGNVPKRKTEYPMQPGHLRLVMVYFILAIPYLVAAGMVAAGLNPWASFAAGYMLHVFILHGLTAED